MDRMLDIEKNGINIIDGDAPIYRIFKGRNWILKSEDAFRTHEEQVNAY